MSRQFGRDWSVQVGRFSATGLDLEFTVEKTIRAEPNTARIGVYNLTRSQRAEIEGAAEGVTVRLEAGYQEPGRGVIFLGKLKPSGAQWSGADVVTWVEGKDRGSASLAARVSRSFAAGTPVRDVVLAAARATGAGLGLLPELDLKLETGARVFGNGTVLDGLASAELTALLRSCGYRWSVRDGVIQVVQRGQAEQRAIAYVLRADTGLLETPKIAKNTITVKALLNPAVYPGRIVEVQSENYTGQIRAEVVRYQGSTTGPEWSMEIEGKVGRG